MFVALGLVNQKQKGQVPSWLQLHREPKALGLHETLSLHEKLHETEMC